MASFAVWHIGIEGKRYKPGERLPEMDDAIDLFLRRRLQGRPLDDKLIRKTVDALIRRGHSYSDIQAGLRRFEAGLELEETWEDTQ